MQVHLFSLLCDSPFCEHSTIYLSVFSGCLPRLFPAFAVTPSAAVNSLIPPGDHVREFLSDVCLGAEFVVWHTDIQLYKRMTNNCLPVLGIVRFPNFCPSSGCANPRWSGFAFPPMLVILSFRSCTYYLYVYFLFCAVAVHVFSYCASTFFFFLDKPYFLE